MLLHWMALDQEANLEEHIILQHVLETRIILIYSGIRFVNKEHHDKDDLTWVES